MTARTAGELSEWVRSAAALVKSVLASLPPERLDEMLPAGSEPVTGRFAVVHALEHA